MIGYYVTIRRGQRHGYLLGPFDSEPEARKHVDRAAKLASDADSFAWFDEFGTARVESARLPKAVFA